MLAGALGFVVVLFAVSTLPGVRSEPGFDPLFDGWLRGTGYVLVGTLALVWLATPRTRSPWGWVVGAVVLRCLGFVLYLTWVRHQAADSRLSVADAAWLTSDVLLLVGVWLLMRRSAPRATLTLGLDALLGALTAAALGATFLPQTLENVLARDWDTVQMAVTLAYPMVQVPLLLLVAATVAALQWRASPAVRAVGVGVFTVVATDAVLLYLLLEGGSLAGSWLTALSLGGAALIAGALWLPDDDERRSPPTGARGLVVPVALGVTCVLVLYYVAVNDGGVVATALSLAGVGVITLRVLLTRAFDQRDADAQIAARQEELIRYRALADASGDLIGLAELDGSMVYMNPSGRRLVGLDPEVDIRSMSVPDFLADESVDRWDQVRQPDVLARGVARGEASLRNMQGGPPIPVAVTTFMIRHPATGEPWLLGSVQKDISERVAAENALRRLADERSLLLDHLVQAQEDERARIAVDVHDDSVQALAAVELRLATLRRQLGDGVAPRELVQAVDAIRETAAGATERLRHLLFDLESPAQRTDVVTAIDEAAAYLFDGSTQWSVSAEGELDLAAATRVTVYRIAKEALTNARRHASARHVSIRLVRRAAELDVEVSDDGVGFDQDTEKDRPGHLGLPGMRDRAAIAGGGVSIRSRPGAGTTVSLWLPLDAPAKP